MDDSTEMTRDKLFYREIGACERRWYEPSPRLRKELLGAYSNDLRGKKEFFDFFLDTDFTEDLYKKQALQSCKKCGERVYRSFGDIAKDVELILPLKLESVKKEDYEDLDDKILELLHTLDYGLKDKSRHIKAVKERFALRDGFKSYEDVGKLMECKMQWAHQMCDRVSGLAEGEAGQEIEKLEKEYISRILSKDLGTPLELKKNIVRRFLDYEGDWPFEGESTLEFTFELIDKNPWDFLYGFLHGERDKEEIEQTELYRSWHEKDWGLKEIAGDHDITPNHLNLAIQCFYKLGLFEHKYEKEDDNFLERGALELEE